MIPQSPSIKISTFFKSKKEFWDSGSEENLFYLSRSSWSILSICIFRLKMLDKKRINIFLPDFFCNDPIALLNHSNINILYYEVDT